MDIFRRLRVAGTAARLAPYEEDENPRSRFSDEELGTRMPSDNRASYTAHASSAASTCGAPPPPPLPSLLAAAPAARAGATAVGQAPDAVAVAPPEAAPAARAAATLGDADVETGYVNTCAVSDVSAAGDVDAWREEAGDAVEDTAPVHREKKTCGVVPAAALSVDALVMTTTDAAVSDEIAAAASFSSLKEETRNGDGHSASSVQGGHALDATGSETKVSNISAVDAAAAAPATATDGHTRMAGMPPLWRKEGSRNSEVPATLKAATAMWEGGGERKLLRSQQQPVKQLEQQQQQHQHHCEEPNQHHLQTVGGTGEQQQRRSRNVAPARDASDISCPRDMAQQASACSESSTRQRGPRDIEEFSKDEIAWTSVATAAAAARGGYPAAQHTTATVAEHAAAPAEHTAAAYHGAGAAATEENALAAEAERAADREAVGATAEEVVVVKAFQQRQSSQSRQEAGSGDAALPYAEDAATATALARGRDDVIEGAGGGGAAAAAEEEDAPRFLQLSPQVAKERKVAEPSAAANSQQVFTDDGHHQNNCSNQTTTNAAPHCCTSRRVPCRRFEDHDALIPTPSRGQSFFENFFFFEEDRIPLPSKGMSGARRAITEQDIHKDFETSPYGGGTLVSRARKRAKSGWESFSFWKALLSFLPIVHVLRTYRASYIMPDFFAGISEGVMAVPMGMSYAMLAKLPPQYGLYVGVFYPLVYTCVGSSAQVNVGVSAIEDLLTGEAVSRIIHEKDWVLQLLAKKQQLQQQQQEEAEQQKQQQQQQQKQQRQQQQQHGASKHHPQQQQQKKKEKKKSGDDGETKTETQPQAHWTLLQQHIQLEETLLEKMRLDISIGLCVCIGIVYVIMRVLQAHMLADLLSVPVLSGFSTASAFLVGTSQLKHFFGLAVPPQVENADFKLPRQWWYFVTHLFEANWTAVVMCLICIGILALCKFCSRRYLKKFPVPGPLLIAVLFTLITYLARLDHHAGLRVIGNIPRGFPSPSLSTFSVSVITYDEQQEPHITHRIVFLDMLRESLSLTAMFFIIHISIAKTLAQQKNSYQLQPEQELVALACCNFFGSIFQCFPCATSLSRSSVAAAAGARTQLHSLSNVLTLVLTLSLITPLLYYLPTAVLAAVVLVGVSGMVDFRELIRLCKIGGPDLLLWVACFLTTIIFGAVEGIIASIVLSLLWLLRKTARPPCITLGRLPHTCIYRNIRRFPMATEHPGIKIVRFDASLNFSNSDFFEARVRQKLQPGTRVLVVDGSSINDLDITAVRMLQRLCGYLQKHEILLLFANWKGPMRDFLERTAFYRALPPEFCFLSLQDAVYYAQVYVHREQQRQIQTQLSAGEQQHCEKESHKSFLEENTTGRKRRFAPRACRRRHSSAALLEALHWQGQEQEEEQEQERQQQQEEEQQQREEDEQEEQQQEQEEQQQEEEDQQQEQQTVRQPLQEGEQEEVHAKQEKDYVTLSVPRTQQQRQQKHVGLGERLLILPFWIRGLKKNMTSGESNTEGRGGGGGRGEKCYQKRKKEYIACRGGNDKFVVYAEPTGPNTLRERTCSQGSCTGGTRWRRRKSSSSSVRHVNEKDEKEKEGQKKTGQSEQEEEISSVSATFPSPADNLEASPSSFLRRKGEGFKERTADLLTVSQQSLHLDRDTTHSGRTKGRGLRLPLYSSLMHTEARDTTPTTTTALRGTTATATTTTTTATATTTATPIPVAVPATAVPGIAAAATAAATTAGESCGEKGGGVVLSSLCNRQAPAREIPSVKVAGPYYERGNKCGMTKTAAPACSPGGGAAAITAGGGGSSSSVVVLNHASDARDARSSSVHTTSRNSLTWKQQEGAEEAVSLVLAVQQQQQRRCLCRSINRLSEPDITQMQQPTSEGEQEEFLSTNDDVKESHRYPSESSARHEAYGHKHRASSRLWWTPTSPDITASSSWYSFFFKRNLFIPQHMSLYKGFTCLLSVVIVCSS